MKLPGILLVLASVRYNTALTRRVDLQPGQHIGARALACRQTTNTQLPCSSSHIQGRMGSSVAIIGAGPAGLGLALALARRGTSRTITVYDLAEDHATAPRYNPDRSYTIDITGHGARTLEYLDVANRFNRELIKFAGIRGVCLGKDEPWVGPGWTGSRGDICRTLMAEIKVLPCSSRIQRPRA